MNIIYDNIFIAPRGDGWKGAKKTDEAKKDWLLLMLNSLVEFRRIYQEMVSAKDKKDTETLVELTELSGLVDDQLTVLAEIGTDLFSEDIVRDLTVETVKTLRGKNTLY